MKKFLSILTFCITCFALLLTACGDDNGGTCYPTISEMKTNLENDGYTVIVSTDLDGKNGTYLSATKESDYIYFYRPDSGADCEYFYNYLEEKCTDYNSLVQIANDKKFGNIVYCGTKNAVDTSGIVVVNVKGF